MRVEIFINKMLSDLRGADILLHRIKKGVSS